MPYIGNIVQDFSVSTAMLNSDSVTSIKVLDGTIVNADINDSAAIAMSKLALSITNSEVNASAAIAGTKISPDFGSQNVVTTGTLGSSDLTITSAAPALLFTETNGDPDYKIQSNAGVLKIVDNTNSADRLVVNTDGHIDVAGNLDVGAGLDVTGAITATGNITASGGRLTLEDTNEEQIHRFWNSTSDSDIDGLLTGSTFGTLLEGANNGHHVIALRDNDGSDSVAIISGGGNFQDDDTYDTVIARFMANGNVAIGNHQPASPLHLKRSSGEAILTIESESGNDAMVFIDTSGGTGANADVRFARDGSTKGRISFLNEGTGQGDMRFTTGSDSEAMRIDSSGKVGIGTTSPLSNSVLHVKSSDTADYRPLVVEGSATNGSGISIHNSGAQRIFIGSGGGNNLSGSSTSDGVIRTETNTVFAVGNSEKMRIDSSGRLIIGFDSDLSGGDATALLQLTQSGGGTLRLVRDDTSITSGNNLGQIHFSGRDGGASVACGAIIGKAIGTHTTTSRPTAIIFNTTASGSATPTERFRIQEEGGISFNGDTTQANALDDYEEGTFTPIINGTGSNNSKTYVTQTGVYTKIGNMVFVRFRVSWSARTADSGSAVIGGFPFGMNDSCATGGAFGYNNLSFGGTSTSKPRDQILETRESAAEFLILTSEDSAAFANVAASIVWNSTGEVRGTAFYLTTQ